jgi:hypothetical protein
LGLHAEEFHRGTKKYSLKGKTMMTLVASPSNIIPVQSQNPTLKDSVGGGSYLYRRQYTRPLKRWEMTFPGFAEDMDLIAGFFDYAQGDTPIWFDGAGTLEVTEPILIGVADSVRQDWDLPHRYVFVASAVIYVNGSSSTDWSPLGGDGITMDKIHFGTAFGGYAQIKAKYRRKAKVVLDAEGDRNRGRVFRDQSDNRKSIYQERMFLQEVPN